MPDEPKTCPWCPFAAEDCGAEACLWPGACRHGVSDYGPICWECVDESDLPQEVKDLL